MAGNGYGRESPEGIPQSIWDRAVEEWLNDITARVAVDAVNLAEAV